LIVDGGAVNNDEEDEDLLELLETVEEMLRDEHQPRIKDSITQGRDSVDKEALSLLYRVEEALSSVDDTLNDRRQQGGRFGQTRTPSTSISPISTMSTLTSDPSHSSPEVRSQRAIAAINIRKQTSLTTLHQTPLPDSTKPKTPKDQSLSPTQRILRPLHPNQSDSSPPQSVLPQSKAKLMLPDPHIILVSEEFVLPPKTPKNRDPAQYRQPTAIENRHQYNYQKFVEASPSKPVYGGMVTAAPPTSKSSQATNSFHHSESSKVSDFASHNAPRMTTPAHSSASIDPSQLSTVSPATQNGNEGTLSVLKSGYVIREIPTIPKIEYDSFCAEDDTFIEVSLYKIQLQMDFDFNVWFSASLPL
jgi:hypothetical protein